MYACMQKMRAALEGDLHPHKEAASDADDFVDGGAAVVQATTASAIRFRAEDVIPPAVTRLFHGGGTSSKDVWNMDADATFFNSDLSNL
jgi:hypothetical protein